MARIILGISGGIAAYKACEIIRLLVTAGHDVVPLPTRGAQRFVTAETFAALARTEAPAGQYPHLQRADLIVVAPLTAHTMARLAHGLADDVLTEAVLAHDGPVLVAPAMNTRMWEHPATQANHELLRARGVGIVGPASGDLAEGEVGVGRMAEPAEIVAAGGIAARAVDVAQRQARRRHRRRHARADRLGAVHRQSLVGTHGRRARRRGAPAWRPGDAARGQSRPEPARQA